MRVVIRMSSVSACALVAACAATGETPTTFVGPAPQVCPAPVQMVSEVRQLTPERGKRSARHKNARLASANIVDAMTIYPWRDGQVYQVAVQRNRITTIRLQPGEVIPGRIAWHDHANWKVGVTQFGSEEGPVTTVLVRALAEATVTDMVIATDRRVYQVELMPYGKPAMDMVRWEYGGSSGDGFDDLMPQPQQQQRGPMTASLGGTYAGIDPTAVNRSYAIRVSAGSPSWTPVAVSDYGGSQVYIEFPVGMGAIAQPVLYEVADGGLRGTIPYSIQNGRFYRTHRSFTEAELRLGSDAVRITKTAAR